MSRLRLDPYILLLLVTVGVASLLPARGMVALSFLAGGLGVIGLVFMAFGVIAPHVLHLH